MEFEVEKMSGERIGEIRENIKSCIRRKPENRKRISSREELSEEFEVEKMKWRKEWRN